ncbi:MAG: DegV family protein [Polyangiaceae bacterium]
MLILTNPGSNLSQALVRRYDIRLTPQQIVVDGEAHDTRQRISFEQIDQWVQSAKVHPHVLGTSAAEFAATFSELAREDPEILAVMTSRKIINSYDSAVSAVRTLQKQPAFAGLRVAVADTGSTDVGAALATLMAAEARQQGLSLEHVASLLEEYRTQSATAFTVRQLDYLVKGGRATALRAWLAGVLRVLPLLSFVDGEIKVVEKIATSADPVMAIADYLSKRVTPGRPAWIGVFHGNVPTAAQALEDELRKRFDVRYAYSHPLAPAIYLHGGPGCLGGVVVPLDGLSYQPPTPDIA